MAAKKKREQRERQAMCGIPWSRKKRWDRTPPIEYNEMNICYFMGLCSAILLTDEVHRANGSFKLEVVEEKVRDNNGVLIGFTQKHTGKILPDLKWDELAEYAHKLGDRFYYDYLQEQALLKRHRKAVKRLSKCKAA